MTKGVTNTVSFITLSVDCSNIFSLDSEATKSSQLIGKNKIGRELEPNDVLVYILHRVFQRFLGGGALLTSTIVIAPFTIFRDYYTTSGWFFTNFRVAIAPKKDGSSSSDPNYQHSIEDIKHNIGQDCPIERAIAILIIKPRPNSRRPTLPLWAQHIALAPWSYTPGQHRVSESFTAWDEVRKNHNSLNTNRLLLILIQLY